MSACNEEGLVSVELSFCHNCAGDLYCSVQPRIFVVGKNVPVIHMIDVS